MDIHFKQRQIGTLVLIVFGIAFAIFAALINSEAPLLYPIIICALLLLCALLFWSLNVEVTDENIDVSFGFGLIRKSIPVSEVQSARPVRNRWYYGWGVRMFPGGWMFNVSGLDAVELDVRNKRKFRIGTNQSQELATAIEKAIAANREQSDR